MDLAEQLIADIERFKTDNRLDRCVMVWCGSTEIYREPSRRALDAGERSKRGLEEQRRRIPVGMIYAYARSARAFRTPTPRRT